MRTVQKSHHKLLTVWRSRLEVGVGVELVSSRYTLLYLAAQKLRLFCVAA